MRRAITHRQQTIRRPITASLPPPSSAARRARSPFRARAMRSAAASNRARPCRRSGVSKGSARTGAPTFSTGRSATNYRAPASSPCSRSWPSGAATITSLSPSASSPIGAGSMRRRSPSPSASFRPARRFPPPARRSPMPSPARKAPSIRRRDRAPAPSACCSLCPARPSRSPGGRACPTANHA